MDNSANDYDALGFPEIKQFPFDGAEEVFEWIKWGKKVLSELNPEWQITSRFPSANILRYNVEYKDISINVDLFYKNTFKLHHGPHWAVYMNLENYNVEAACLESGSFKGVENYIFRCPLKDTGALMKGIKRSIEKKIKGDKHERKK